MKITRTRWKRRCAGGLLALLLLGAGYAGGRHYAWPAVKAWRVERMNRDARAFLADGDLPNALMAARKSLQASTRNPDAWRIAAEASAARDRPDAVWYQENLCREEPTWENQRELIRLALRFGVPGNALAALETVAGEARSGAEFHRLAAEVYRRLGRPAEAASHLLELTRLEPADGAAQLDLAGIGLAADPQRTDRALRARVLALADQPELRVRALTLLLRENVAAQATDGTGELVRRLQAEPEPDVTGSLLMIEARVLLGSPDAGPALARLQAEVADRPAEAARVLAFLVRSGRAGEARRWFDLLPEETRADEDARHAQAEALLALGDAPALEAALRAVRWPKHEYLRNALLAHACRAQGRAAEFAEAWNLALIDAGSDTGKAVALLARTEEWRWVNERHDVIWSLFALVPDNASVQQALLLWERHRGNTAGLHRLFTRIVEVSPGDEAARNNLAYTSLLLDTNVARAGLIAAELVKAYPDNTYFGTTQALALCKQGRAAEALALLDSMSSGERAEPVRAVLRAWCLASLGRTLPASYLLDSVALPALLPEERRIAGDVRAEIARRDLVQGNRSRLLAIREGREPGAGGGAGWLAWVDAGTRDAASTDMQLADSLYAGADRTGLRALLRAADWKEENHLRSALLAWVSRQDGDLSQSRDAWRQALALADRSTARLANLRALATRWQWDVERLETLNRIFERDASDKRLLAELLAHYREVRRTPELLRVLGLYLAGHSGPVDDEAVAHAYYSLLLDSNVARAQVTARRAFEAAPEDTVRRLVHAFSLSKQRRAAEARALLAGVGPDAVSGLVPVPLLRAVIEMQSGDTEAARASLARTDLEAALPEEAALAERVSRQLAAQSVTAAAITPPRT